MTHLRGIVALMLVAATATAVQAQVSITPMIGGYVAGSDVNQISSSAQDVAKTREGTLSLGANVEFGMFRGSLMYASGTTIKNANRDDIGKGSVLGAAADLVIRPLPRVFVQPYLVAGVGRKFYQYDESPTLINTDDSDFTFHGGIGADLMLGSIGVAAEVTDFMSKGVDKKWNVHDAFVMVGLKLRVP